MPDPTAAPSNARAPPNIPASTASTIPASATDHNAAVRTASVSVFGGTVFIEFFSRVAFSLLGPLRFAVGPLERAPDSPIGRDYTEPEPDPLDPLRSKLAVQPVAESEADQHTQNELEADSSVAAVA